MNLLNSIGDALRRLRGGAARTKAPGAGEASGRERELSGPTLDEWVTFGAHIYRQKGEKASVTFTNDRLGIRRLIVDEAGAIRHFPGVSPEARARLDGVDLTPRVRFRTSFARKWDGCILMLWQVQPDGRYWADDDGFGMESEEEITLCARIDARGEFTGPFELYAIGHKQYFEYPEPPQEDSGGEPPKA